jgi:hypothetical protein
VPAQPLGQRRRFFEHRIQINCDYQKTATNNVPAPQLWKSSRCTTMTEFEGFRLDRLNWLLMRGAIPNGAPQILRLQHDF